MRIGVSLYPEKESLEDIEQYLKMASQYGCCKVFTSLFTVDGTKEEIIKYFKSLCDMAHKYNMVVSGDANTQFFEKMDADESNLDSFKEMGLDILRMDIPYMDQRDVTLINNSYGIKIELNTAFGDLIKKAIEMGANPQNITTCHNFYPEPYTAPSVKSIFDINEDIHQLGIPITMFISSQVENAHGPYDIEMGLPTIEEHRTLPVDVQLKHILAFKNVDEVLFGNAFASKEEFEAVHQVLTLYEQNVGKMEALGQYADFIPHGQLKLMPFKLHLDKNVSSMEKEILQFKGHADMGDCLNYMLRSRWTRMLYGRKDIPPRVCSKEKFTRGDVLIPNNNLYHYRGELQIVLKEIPNDGNRNYVGRIDEQEIMILDYMGANDLFTFIY